MRSARGARPIRGRNRDGAVYGAAWRMRAFSSSEVGGRRWRDRAGPAASVVGLGRDVYKGIGEPEVAGSVWWEAAIGERAGQESSAGGSSMQVDRVGVAPRRRETVKAYRRTLYGGEHVPVRGALDITPAEDSRETNTGQKRWTTAFVEWRDGRRAFAATWAVPRLWA